MIEYAARNVLRCSVVLMCSAQVGLIAIFLFEQFRNLTFGATALALNSLALILAATMPPLLMAVEAIRASMKYAATTRQQIAMLVGSTVPWVWLAASAFLFAVFRL